MPTTKKRTNVTFPSDIDNTLTYLSKRDDVSKSTKVVQLIKIAIQLEEDEVWNSLAEARDTKKDRIEKKIVKIFIIRHRSIVRIYQL